ncbi:PDGLE domain-containing protein, partial [Eubacterium aggregans]|uniref:PDGLE domain-containing protein n=1 Tax=Eubacterium aggregans TaxID=81409 RepID=UPI003F342166
TSFMPDYDFSGGEGSAMGTTTAGLIGAGITLLLAGWTGLVITKVKNPTNLLKVRLSGGPYDRFSQSLNTLTSIEELVDGQTIIHRLHPGVNLALTFLYLVLVLSCHVYNPGLLAVFAFFPFILMSLAEIPWRPLFKRVAIALPFVAFAGIANLIFDRQVVRSLALCPSLPAASPF